MKILLLSAVATIGALHFGDNVTGANDKPGSNFEMVTPSSPGMLLQDSDGSGRMASIVFKSQDYCRVELKDFQFDVRFDVVSATVYFTGENFKEVKRGYITSSSLKPIKDLMRQCQPGSIVTFDEIKVKGPDNMVRTLPGVSYILY